RKLPALLQLDTGMSRLGLSASEFERLLENFALLDNIDIKFVISHLASGDEPENAANARQLANMSALLVRLPQLPVAFANSGRSFLHESSRFDRARPGPVLYGVGPDKEVVPARPLPARVIQVRATDKGAVVGDGGTYVAEGPMGVATIAV